MAALQITRAAIFALFLAAIAAGSTAQVADSAVKAGPRVVLATKGSSEDQLLGQLYKQTLEARGFSVDYRSSYRSTSALQEALAGRRIDVYVDYTGQIVETVFARRAPRAANASYDTAKALLAGRGFALLRPSQYVASGSVVALRSTAARRGLRSISDLRKIRGLAIGGPTELATTPSGVARMRAVYRLPVFRFVPLDPSAYARSLAAGRVDAIIVGPSIRPPSGAVRLNDPRRHFSPQNVAPVMAAELPGRLGVTFTSAFDALGGRLTQRSITSLTAAVVLRSRRPAGVARTFLISTDLITAANVFVAPNGNDSARNCRRFARAVTSPDASGASVCRTFDRAYRLAAAGDSVGVQAGAYGPQSISPKSGASRPGVVIRAANGGPVTIDDLGTSGNWLTMRNITVATGANHARGWRNTGSNVTLDNVDVTGPWANVKITNGTNVTWRNSSLGDPGNRQRRLCQRGDGEPVELSNVRNLLFSNLDFHPFQPELGNPVCGPDGNMHLETIRVWDGVNGWRMERSRFHSGDGSGSARVFFSKISGADPRDVTFVNNWFGSSEGSVSIYLTQNSPCNNFVFAYNHWEQAFVDECRPKTNLRLIGNTGTKPDYLPCEGITYVRNLWSWTAAGRCGSDRWVTDPCRCLTPLRYAADGYHLQRGSPAINAGEQALCRTLTRGVDIDGRARKGVCDAGPDEYGN